MNFKIYTVVIAIIIAIFFISCDQKEIETTNNKNDVELTDQMKADLKVVERINEFKATLKQIKDNPSIKSGKENMEIDSALWYTSTALNVTYGDACANYGDIETDSMHIIIPVIDGTVEWNTISALYYQIIDSLRIQYRLIETSQKQLTDVYFEVMNVTNSQMKITVHSIYSTDAYRDYGLDVLGWYTFRDWKWRSYYNWNGTCDGLEPAITGGATWTLERMLINRIPAVNGGYYANNNHSAWVANNGNALDYSNCGCGHAFYYNSCLYGSSGYNIDPCIDAETMNCLADAYQTVGEDYRQLHFPNKHVIMYHVYYTGPTLIYDYYIREHGVQYIYASIIYTGNGVEPLD
jgi:hypothetical protein